MEHLITDGKTTQREPRKTTPVVGGSSACRIWTMARTRCSYRFIHGSSRPARKQNPVIKNTQWERCNKSFSPCITSKQSITVVAEDAEFKFKWVPLKWSVSVTRITVEQTVLSRCCVYSGHHLRLGPAGVWSKTNTWRKKVNVDQQSQ